MPAGMLTGGLYAIIRHFFFFYTFEFDMPDLSKSINVTTIIINLTSLIKIV